MSVANAIAEITPPLDEKCSWGLLGGLAAFKTKAASLMSLNKDIRLLGLTRLKPL